jgi:hypothetical protein
MKSCRNDDGATPTNIFRALSTTSETEMRSSLSSNVPGQAHPQNTLLPILPLRPPEEAELGLEENAGKRAADAVERRKPHLVEFMGFVRSHFLS